MWTPLAWTGAAAVSLLALKYFTIPYLWVFLAGATALFVTAAMDRRRRPLWFNVACLGVGLAIFEYYVWSSGPRGFEARRVEAGNYDEFLVDHRQLGWAIQPDSLVTQKLSFEGELLYDAAYTIGPDGLRISSPSTNDDKPSTACALFFGGSFTFGQGLADHEALPFRVHEKSAQRYRTYNFGFPGYGAHQMLSALQHGLVRDTVQCDPTRVSHVFYQGITDHISRSAGRLWWWERGPKYVLTDNGGVRLDGRFEDNDDFQDRSLVQILGAQIYKSMIYHKIVQGRYVSKYGRGLIDLYLEIIDEARRVALADYPAADFHVLLWDEDNADNRAIREGLRQRGINLHLMSHILPNYRADDLNQQYRIHVRDPHPNALANKLIAQYLIREIMGEPEDEREVSGDDPPPRSATRPPRRS